jgi:hypothetical protein
VKSFLRKQLLDAYNQLIIGFDMMKNKCLAGNVASVQVSSLLYLLQIETDHVTIISQSNFIKCFAVIA